MFNLFLGRAFLNHLDAARADSVPRYLNASHPTAANIAMNPSPRTKLLSFHPIPSFGGINCILPSRSSIGMRDTDQISAFLDVSRTHTFW